MKTSDGFMEDNSVSFKKYVKVSVSADHLPPKYQFFDVQRNAASEGTQSFQTQLCSMVALSRSVSDGLLWGQNVSDNKIK